MGNGGQRYVNRCVKLITHQEPIEGIQVWIFLGYPSNILGYTSNILGYASNILGYTSK